MRRPAVARRAGRRAVPRRRGRPGPGVALAAVIAAALCGADGAAGATLTEHMDVGCVQDEPLVLSCRYRLLDAGRLGSAVAEFEGTIVTGTMTSGFPAPGEHVDALILVDTSDPARAPVIATNVQHIDALLTQAASHYRFGLAGFDTNLYVLAPVGSSPEDVREGAAALSATGRTTELYRNVLEAVRLLARSQAERRVLFLFSDGLAEDYAYHHEDVVELARETGVIIHAIGYPRSVAQSVALQTLRRLAAETGGLYVQADHLDRSIPEDSFGRMLAATDSGGSLRFDLGPLADAGVAGAIDVSLAFQTATQSFLVLAPVSLPVNDTLVPAPPVTDATSPPQPRPLARPPAAAPPAGPPWPWIAILLSMLALVLLGVAALLVRARYAAAARTNSTAAKPLAWLLPGDDTNTRHVIDRTPWRIGRGRSNDLTLSDHSVSRLHAEIRSNEEGALLLKDLESLNGVFVNDNRVDAMELREGDIVDIGDVRLRFTLHDEHYAAEEATVLVRTRTPI